MCETLGCTKSELMNRMSSYEMSEWIQEYKLRHKEEEDANRKAKSKKK